MEYKEEDTFVLFKNDKKSDNHPDYKGSLTWGDGTKKDIAVWIRTSKKGVKFMSGKISEPWKQEEQQRSIQAEEDLNDEIPF